MTKIEKPAQFVKWKREPSVRMMMDSTYVAAVQNNCFSPSDEMMEQNIHWLQIPPAETEEGFQFLGGNRVPSVKTEQPVEFLEWERVPSTKAKKQ